MTSDPNADIRELFRRFIPEVATGVVEVVSIARKPGNRVVVAVRSHDELVHAVTVCVGTNGIHPKTIMRELHGEKVSIVLWSESPERFVLNAVAPFGPSAVQTPKVSVDLDSRRARIEVGPETLAYFKAEDPSRLHLASELVGLDIEIVPLGSG